MAQLLNISTDSFKAVRFSENARLVSEDSLDIERRKAMARHKAFAQRAGASTNVRDVSNINRAFSSSRRAPAPQPVHTPQASVSSTASRMAAPAPSANQVNPGTAVVQNNSSVSVADANINYSPGQAQASYNVERGAFEMRVASGSLSFVPALSMTIITQYPEVHFEYTGGFNYFPESADPGQQLNLSV
ncbi:hypothetical protein AALA00_01085 [Lachnospiraceae bacterium 46-15]